MVFDKELVPIEGVYELTKWYTKNGTVDGIRSGQSSYDAYPTFFPNKGKYNRDDKKGLVTFEAGLQVIFGEAALKLDNLGFEAGVEGNLIKGEYASEKGVGFSSFIAKNNPDNTNKIKEDKDLKLGIGGGIEYVGFEYRKGMNGKDGTFGDNYLEADGPFTKLDANITKSDGSFKIGIPEAKVSMGIGLKGWFNLSINPQPILTGYEKIEKDALQKFPKGTKTTPE